MDKLYDYTGAELQIGDGNHDAMMVETKNLLSLGLDRVTKLEAMQSEYEIPVLRLTGDMTNMSKDTAMNMIAEYSDGVRSFKCIAKTNGRGRTP